MARRIAAVIPHRNRPQILVDSLKKLVSLWGNSLKEIIVVDDGSDADHVPIESNLPGSGLCPIRVISKPTSIGPAGCRNFGVNQTEADYVLFLDDDAYPQEGSLDQAAAAFDAHPELAAIGFRIMLGEHAESGGAFNVIVGCGALVRRSHFQEVGGFDPSIRFYAEEYALCYAFIQAGYEIRIWDTPVIFHQKSTAGRQRSLIIGNLVRNNRRVFEPHLFVSTEVGQRIEEMKQWYGVLADREGGQEEYEEALDAPIQPAAEKPWSIGQWRKISGLDILDQWCQHLKSKGIRAVSLWPVGKDCATFARALRRVGINPMEVLDPNDRFELYSFCELLVRREPDPLSECTVVASLSPGQCWNAIHGRTIESVPRLAYAFGYVGPSVPFDKRVRAGFVER